MSKYPKIYGFCDAGCKWETVHMEDFHKAAYMVPIAEMDGLFFLECGNAYRIKKTTEIESSEYGFKLSVRFVIDEAGTTKNIDSDYIDISADGAYKPHITVRPFRAYESETGYLTFVLDIDGEIRSLPVYSIADSNYEAIVSAYVIVTDAEECYRINESAEILASAKNAFIRYSANADGTDFTETWSEGQLYVGFATGLEAPTNKEEYEWALFSPKTGAEVVQAPGASKVNVMSQDATTNLTILNALVLIGNNGDLYVEYKSGSYYIKPIKSDGSVTTICIYSERTPSRVLEWSEVLTTMSSCACTSPTGVADCLCIDSGYVFVYNILTNKVERRYTYNCPSHKYIHLFVNNYGHIGGKLNDLRNRKNADRLAKLEALKLENNTGIGVPVLIGTNGYLYIEKKSGGSCYIQTRASATSTSTENILLYCENLGGFSAKFAWDDICTKFSSRVQTSPNGVEKCLYMGETNAFVYNTKTRALEIVDITKVDIQHHVVLFGYYWGFPYGRLVEANNRWVRKDLDTLNSKVDGLYLGFPDYYVTEIIDTKAKLSVLPADNFNYLVISDIHNSDSKFTYDRLKTLVGSLVNIANSSNIDAVICLGDLIEGGMGVLKSTAKTEMMEIVELLGDCRKPVLFAFGNHDQNAYNWSGSDTTDHYILLNEWINMCVRPFIKKNDYYAVDFDDKGIRLIITNTCDYDEQVDDYGNVTISGYAAIMMRQEQLDDICDMLDDTTHDIVVCGHALPTNLLDLLKAFNTRSTYTKSNGTTVNFSGKTNRILLYNFGHHHNEAFEYVSAYDLNMFAASCGSLSTVQQDCWISNKILATWKNTDEGVVERVAGEISEACYYVVSIGDGKINKINFGAGDDGVLAL